MTDTPNPNELPAVARNIHLMCKKCGIERYHVVVAHTTATSAKVKCEVCGASSTYKLKAEKKKSVSSTGVAKKPRAAKKTEPDASVAWAELKSQIGTDRVVPYSMKTKYALANAIEHPKFGLGFVTAASNDKIQVMFQDGGRPLVHNRP
jgi:ribosomal protein L37E